MICLKNMLTTSNFTYGCELELGDVPRNRAIPEELGKWNYCESDAVNLTPPYRGIAFDPMGIDPPVGGEINTRPTGSVSSQIELIENIFSLFPEATCSSCPNNTHFHISSDYFLDDLDKIKKIASYIFKNQESFVLQTFPFTSHPLMKFTKTANEYLIDNNSSLLSQETLNSILELDDIQHLTKHVSKPDTRWNISKRNAINLASICKNKTLEFRCFWGTTNITEIRCGLEACDEFLKAALFTDEPFESIRQSNSHWVFPKLQFDYEVYKGWENTCKRKL